MNPTLSNERRDVAARINLWLVDDHEEFRERFGLLLSRFFGFERVHHFQSAEASIEALKVAANPDVVLLDVKLPGMNGVEAVRVIKATSPATRVIMLATYFDVSAAKQAQADGACAFFTKNQPYEDLVAAVIADPGGETRP